VEVNRQLSNRAIKERINALWSLTRDNVSTRLGLTIHLCPSRPYERRNGSPGAKTGARSRELTQGYVDGVPVDELAATFQVDQSTVQKHARRHGVPRRSPRLGPRQSEGAAQLCQAGQSLAKLTKPLWCRY